MHAKVAKLSNKRSLDCLPTEKYGRAVISFNPPLSAIRRLLSDADEAIGGLAAIQKVLEIYAHNPDTIIAFVPIDGKVDGFDNPNGFIAKIPLTEDGVAALFDGRFSTVDPDVSFISRQHETPAAVYIWAIYTPPGVAGGIAHIMDRLSANRYRSAPLYCKAANLKAENFFLTLGFKKGARHGKIYSSEIMEYRRLNAPADTATDAGQNAPAPRPLYDSFEDSTGVPNGTRTIGIKVIRTMDDLQKVMAIRAATYLVEQDMPYIEDVDGNDFTGTHLLGHVGNEPAGTLRIRYFASFAKFERLAVLPRFRGTRLAFRMIEAGIQFCQRKGYTSFYGHADPRVTRLWQRFGFKPRVDEPVSYLTDQTYLQGDLTLPPVDDALTNREDPFVLLRPEGQWDRPGALELEMPSSNQAA